MQNIKIMNTLDICVIDIEGAIGVAEEWQFENAGERIATYEKFRDSLSQIEALEASQVVVNIRSTGGDVNDALLIYEALSSLDIPITTCCYGYVASAATVIAQAASEGLRQISANALYLVHNSTCVAEGSASDLNSRAELLLKTDERLADLYARRSGRTIEDFTALMGEDSGKGRWLSAQETIDAGLADSIIDTASEGDSSSVQNFWRKVGAALGFSTTESEVTPESMPQAASHNILHGESAATQSAAAIKLFEQKQAAVGPTILTQVEDPTLKEVNPDKNHRAYASDVQAFKR